MAMFRVLFVVSSEYERVLLRDLFLADSRLSGIYWRVESVGWLALDACAYTSSELARCYDIVIRVGYAPMTLPDDSVLGKIVVGSVLHSIDACSYSLSVPEDFGVDYVPVVGSFSLTKDVSEAVKLWPRTSAVVYDSVLQGIYGATRCLSEGTFISAVYMGVVDPLHQEFDLTSFQQMSLLVSNLDGLADVAVRLVLSIVD